MENELFIAAKTSKDSSQRNRTCHGVA